MEVVVPLQVSEVVMVVVLLIGLTSDLKSVVVAVSVDVVLIGSATSLQGMSTSTPSTVVVVHTLVDSVVYCFSNVVPGEGTMAPLGCNVEVVAVTVVVVVVTVVTVAVTTVVTVLEGLERPQAHMQGSGISGQLASSGRPQVLWTQSQTRPSGQGWQVMES